MSTGRSVIPNHFTVDIHTACKDNDMKSVEQFFKEGGDPNVRCRVQTIGLHRAAFYGHPELCRYLISKGSNIEACDPHDHTPLFWACRAGLSEIVRLLLEAGSYIDAKDKKDRTALFEACFYGHPDVVSLLLEWRAKTDLTDRDDNEPAELFDSSVPTDVQERIQAMIEAAPKGKQR